MDLFSLWRFLIPTHIFSLWSQEHTFTLARLSVFGALSLNMILIGTFCSHWILYCPKLVVRSLMVQNDSQTFDGFKSQISQSNAVLTWTYYPEGGELVTQITNTTMIKGNNTIIVDCIHFLLLHWDIAECPAPIGYRKADFIGGIIGAGVGGILFGALIVVWAIKAWGFTRARELIHKILVPLRDRGREEIAS